MSVAHEPNELRRILDRALTVSLEHPVVVSKFETHAREIEIDAVADQGEIVLWAISEHIEDAGVHSGDATLVLPPQMLYVATIRRIKKIAADVARALEITGPFNMQFLAKLDQVKVIECNLRASRSFPFVSKVTGTNFVAEAMRRMLGVRQSDREPQPGARLRRGEGADVLVLAPGRGGSDAGRRDVEHGRGGVLRRRPARGAAARARRHRVPLPDAGRAAVAGSRAGQVLVRRRGARDRGGARSCRSTRRAGTAEALHGLGIPATRLEKHEGPDSGMRAIDEGKVDLVINVPVEYDELGRPDGYMIRRGAVDAGIPLITDLQLARAVVEALRHRKMSDLRMLSYDEFLTRIR